MTNFQSLSIVLISFMSYKLVSCVKVIPPTFFYNNIELELISAIKSGR